MIKKLKYCAVIATSLTLTSLNAYGAVKSNSMDLAQQVVKAVHATDQFDMFLPQATSLVKRRLLVEYPKNSDVINKVVDEEAMKLVKRRAELDDAAAKIYIKHFSPAELKSIVAFYTGPVGSKLLQTAPQTMGDLIKAFQSWSVSVGKALEDNSRAAVKSKVGAK